MVLGEQGEQGSVIMECSIQFNTNLVYNGSTWKIRINHVELDTAFKRKQDAELIIGFLRRNAQKLCDALSGELEK